MKSTSIMEFAARRWLGLACLACLICQTPTVSADDNGSSTNEVRESVRRLKQMTLEEILDEPVTIVSRSPESVSAAAAAVQVIKGEEIQRSSATRLPEALRLAPNLEVARVNSSEWAVSARGFNNTLANKLLVMIDGRTIYTPLYAGVFWDAQNVLLEDVDRIEIVSGPGGTLWGANAVNGVINVVTKTARETQGAYVSAAAGSLMQDYVAGRYGGAINSNLFFRAYAQRLDYNETLLPNGNDAPDRWDVTQGGFRTDWYPAAENAFTLQGDFYAGGNEANTAFDGQNILGRWVHQVAADSEMQIQLYWDRTWRQIPNSFRDELNTFDLDFQHSLALSPRQELVWGAGYRAMFDRTQPDPLLAFIPANKDLHLFSFFAQDDIVLVPELMRLTIGSKLEHNSYSGFEWQPNVRLAWTPDEYNTVWAAFSRAVRSPSRIDADVRFPSPPFPPGTTNLVGNPDFDSEKLLAFELGYRARPVRSLLLSLASYYNRYTDLRSLDQLTPGDFVLRNHFQGEVWGVELSAQYQICDEWRLRAGYNYINKHLSPHGGLNVASGLREGNDPEHQFTLHSIVDLPGNFQFDATARYVDELTMPHVNDYFAFDARLAWRCKNLEISIVGQNLTDDRHAEFGTWEIPRSVYGKVTWRY